MNRLEALAILAQENQLRPRHIQIIEQLLSGKNLTETAEELGISYRTAKNHMERIYSLGGWRNFHQVASSIMDIMER
ncbi:LuxR C-terminal-related transcriptional regulator [Effusibacillus dendaii]|uniref:HTH luxR-type domain-containing protein n=1 Tax=Effusibacillus dendaii TaxID=2743772 RepID=A0A7I8D8L6_9BACL|nr:LuxR C-terminal-related transcriptional regulator [Effusibacillus dendaii]BCJ86478.1 hypothetical protein skT53_14630 [Effusibacillus dendaii]